MFDLFTFPLLAKIGLPLVGLPVLIHLINVLRHRRVKWAAMDFLLQSQKRQKRWIRLKELLLLLLRMAAMAAVAFMLAQPVLRNQWSELLGGSETHHIVLLDDSYSMADRGAEGVAFERAKQVTLRLARQAAAQGGAQRFTLLRYSQAGSSNATGKHDWVQAEMGDMLIADLETRLAAMNVSQTAATSAEALEAVRSLPERSEDENRIVYVVSDFRAGEWNDPKNLHAAIGRLSAEKTTVRLVHCVDVSHPNLGIARLEPEIGASAAGVEQFIQVAVTNFGDATARRIAVSLEENGHSRPGLAIEEIEPGETVTRRFRVNFPTSGQHTLVARLPADALETDNVRYSVVDVADEVPVLVIDGSERNRDGFFLASALDPGGKVLMGLKPQIESVSFLRKPERLAEFSTIFLLDTPPLDDVDIAALEAFVEQGGGIGVFVGENTRGRTMSVSMYRNGGGMLPLPLSISTNLLPDPVENLPDLEVEQHPIFRSFLAMRNNPLDDVRIERYFAVPDDWNADESADVRVLARLRNGAPLIVEKRLGNGRTVVVLTKVSPEATSLGSWNDWARNYSFLPTMMSLQAHLAAGRAVQQERLVGAPLSLALDANRYHSQLQFAIPDGKRERMVLLDASKSAEGLLAEIVQTDRQGLYRAELRTRDDDEEQRLFAYNVSPPEGDLHSLDVPQLAARMGGLPIEIHRAADLEYDPEELAGFNLSQPLLFALLAILIVEQILAYFCGYHPPARRSAR
ncbi:MAG: BatA domain-containing protein [Planctomycetales bacterium]|nr:BatA domain-containing protein [Planctomycetales bacterium]